MYDKDTNKIVNKKDEVTEYFCPSCLVMPLAFVSAGAVVAGENVSNKHKKWKRGLLITGVISLIVLVCLIVYYYFLQNDCGSGSCKLRR